ncbi:GIDA-domain-containing protein [Guyanagaster necrorhizus]|uniref:GIDA-domain-containing protein n=1 Tax=Guyanagaster necrorhizus TaxID=856835 RepID=A0A9P7VM05_9AGAR|nr:GIDA-domain-containing protein [Guyanagaster necrorhizus MCA 3950]KAG7442990.1 GIDA-domain-containing protein [Guyanagaster necrorhizus MCA 3950]
MHHRLTRQSWNRSRLYRYFSSATEPYQVCVIGASPAGCEAAAASARVGARTLLLTKSMDDIGELSCNPSIGGVGKGTLVREVDAMDGLMAKVADESGSMFQMLNATKGSAVWGARAQIDRTLYKRHMKRGLRVYQQNLSIRAARASGLLFDSGGHDLSPSPRVAGVRLDTGEIIHCSKVILCATREYHIGTTFSAGEDDFEGLSSSLRRMGVEFHQLHTMTPPRLDGKTIDYTNLTRQDGDVSPSPFSFLNSTVVNAKNQLPRYMTRTTSSTHHIVRANMHLSALIEIAKGTQYCPSLEAKSLRFSHNSHLVWLESEGYDTDVIYANGLACTLPEEVQEPILRTIPGLENVKMIRPAYGMKYDHLDPRTLTATLEGKHIKGFYCAGKAIGTPGYEEAAAQGIIAGTNAARSALGRGPFLLKKSDSFIGALTHDLITGGAKAPQKTLTSRADHLLFLRPDNAHIRLTEKAYGAGVVSRNRMELHRHLLETYNRVLGILKQCVRTSQSWRDRGLSVAHCGKKKSAFHILRLPFVSMGDLMPELPFLSSVDPTLLKVIENDGKYSPHLAQRKLDMKVITKNGLDPNLDYSKLDAAMKRRLFYGDRLQQKARRANLGGWMDVYSGYRVPEKEANQSPYYT